MLRTTAAATVLACFAAASTSVPHVPSPVRGWKGSPVAQVRLEKAYGQLPLVFEPNRGQADRRVRWLARGRGYGLFVTESEAVLALLEGKGKPSSAVRMRLAGSRRWRLSEGLEPTGGISNYFLGNDPKQWRTDIPHYRRVKFGGVYAGIDLVLYGNAGKLEYDLVVAPGADPGQIRLAYEGVKRIEVDAGGHLVLTTETGAELRQQRPRVYQEIEGRNVEVAGVYEILDRRQVAIQVAFYDASRPLVIDPILAYSTYVGGKSGESGAGIAVDSTGAAYVTGSTSSTDFPTQSPYQAANRWGTDVFVTKLAPKGNALLYSTYVGGHDDDYGLGIAVDSAGAAYVTGFTYSTDFPTQSPYQEYRYQLMGKVDAFVTKLSPAGNTLAYSTYLGGSDNDVGHGIAVDGAGSAYVTGYTYSPDFPTQSPYQKSRYRYVDKLDAFVTKLSPAGNTLVYSTYLGGSDNDEGYGIAVDGAGSAYVTGYTHSTDFPTQSPYQATCRGISDAFVTKLTPAGNALVYSTYLGGSGIDTGNGIAVDAAGSAYVTGGTQSTNFPTQSAYQATFQGGTGDAFVTKLTPAGALVYSTYLGGSGSEGGSGIAVDGAGSAYVTGNTYSTNFPTQSPYHTYRGESDAFVAKLSSAGNTLLYSTYLGGSGNDVGYGIAVDSAGAAYVTGSTDSDGFPTQSPYQTDRRGGSDAFISKLDQHSVGLAISGVVNAASYAPVIAPYSYVTILGSGFATTQTSWDTAIPDGRTLPTTLGGVQVKVNGKNAYVSFVSAGQLNVLAPLDTATGSVSVQVTTPEGTATTNATMAQVSPGFFCYVLGGKTHLAAINGVTGALVAPTGALAGVTSRPAKPGDILALYANGLGATATPVPAGQVLATHYPIDNLAHLSVTLGGVPALVRYAGMTMAGMFQVNIEVPAGVRAGEQPVVLTVDGKSTQANAILTFEAAPPPVLPLISSVTPNTAETGTTIPNFTVRGDNLAGVTQLDFSPPSGITVSNLTVNNSTVTAQVMIAADATPGQRAVSVLSPAGRSNSVQFTIQTPTPRLISVSPSSGRRGEDVYLEVIAANVARSKATDIAVRFSPSQGIGAGVYSINDLSDGTSRISATVRIDTSATLGEHTVAVVTDAGLATAKVSNTAIFNVMPRISPFTISNLRAGPLTSNLMTMNSVLPITVDYNDPSGSASSGMFQYHLEYQIGTAKVSESGSLAHWADSVTGQTQGTLRFSFPVRGIWNGQGTVLWFSLTNSRGEDSNVLQGTFAIQ
jgi:uncharacterized protein (TIGR03437 family)